MAQSAANEGRGQFVYKAPAKVLLDSLVRRGLVPPEESAPLLEAARVTRRAVCLLILDLGLLDESALAEALIHAYNLPYVGLDDYTVDSDVLGMVAPDLCWDRRALPVDLVGSTLTLAMVDPLDDRTVTRVSAEKQISVCRAVVVSSELSRALERYYPDYPRPAAAFDRTQAEQALKAARTSLATAPLKQTKRTEEQLPGWLSEADEAAGVAASGGATSPEELSDLPDWLDDDEEVAEDSITPASTSAPGPAPTKAPPVAAIPLDSTAAARGSASKKRPAKRRTARKGKSPRKKRRPRP